jgi:hypothetical protein
MFLTGTSKGISLLKFSGTYTKGLVLLLSKSVAFMLEQDSYFLPHLVPPSYYYLAICEDIGEHINNYK